MAKLEVGKVQDLDSNMRLDNNFDVPVHWLSPKERPFQIIGFPWLAQEGMYRRLPMLPSHPIRDAVDTLANCTAGGQIRFRTDSTRLFIKVVLANKSGMYHMPATGQSGFDCYIGEPGEQKYISTTKFDTTVSDYCVQVFDLSTVEVQMRAITLNFPLYQGVKEVMIGVNPGAQLEAYAPYADDRRIIVYGTSITQGGCASRPGMCYTNIMSRTINQEFINLGFSGNGQGEPELAHIISQIERPALLVLDYEANSGDVTNLQLTLPEFIRTYRQYHAEVPIIVLTRVRYARELFDPKSLKLQEDRREVARSTVQAARDAGDSNIEFLSGADLLGDDFEECTVDGSHPTDLGFLRMATGLNPVFKRILNIQ